MNGQELKRLRARNGWSQSKVAEILNGALGRNYKRGSIGDWENGRNKVPKAVDSFLSTLELEQAFPLQEERPPLEGEHVEPGFDALDDTVPPPPPPSGAQSGELRGQLSLPGGGTYARVCEELWELVATGVGMVGAVTGSENLQADGRIIHADKKALGKAYGKLAETNATFRRMIESATGGGAWLEVALVSGITAGKIMRQHQAPKTKPEPVQDRPSDEAEVTFSGDGAVVSFPTP